MRSFELLPLDVTSDESVKATVAEVLRRKAASTVVLLEAARTPQK